MSSKEPSADIKPPYQQRFLNHDLFIIAEIGGNHEGNLDYAKRLVDLAASSGAQAIKFQIYSGDKIVSSVENGDRNKHFKKFELGYKAYQEFAEIVRSRGLEFMASLWDQEALATFDPYINIHKIGSGDLTNYPLLLRIAELNKPIILATAMSTMADIQGAVAFIDAVNPSLRATGKLCLMHCVALYGDPKDEYANLLAIRHLQSCFPDIHIGYSDHTCGTMGCEIAVALGCRTLEVHFTDDKAREFRDHALSKTTAELQELLRNAKRIISMLGNYTKQPVPEIETVDRIREFRRAVYLREDLPAGTVINEEHLITLRPNHGIDAREYKSIIGHRLSRATKALTALVREDFE